ncbi:hypothetical protein N8D56_25515 (plasmid) [Devosia sp. A8/3-2]|nr:hypothetical protein N8D56_25515 [Devosia sp. A8/3-2]
MAFAEIADTHLTSPARTGSLRASGPSVTVVTVRTIETPNSHHLLVDRSVAKNINSGPLGFAIGTHCHDSDLLKNW